MRGRGRGRTHQPRLRMPTPLLLIAPGDTGYVTLRDVRGASLPVRVNAPCEPRLAAVVVRATVAVRGRYR